MTTLSIKLHVSKPGFEIMDVMKSLVELKTESNVVGTMSTVFRDGIYHIESGCIVTFIETSLLDILKWWGNAHKNMGFNCCYIEDPNMNYKGCMKSWKTNTGLDATLTIGVDHTLITDPLLGSLSPTEMGNLGDHKTIT